MSSKPPLEAKLENISTAPLLKQVESTNQSKMVADPSETIITMIAVGFFGFVLGKAQRAWKTRRQQKGSSRHRSKKTERMEAKCVSNAVSIRSTDQAWNTSSLTVSNKIGMVSTSNSAGPLRACAPKTVVKTNVHCERCAKILDWEEANKPFRTRLRSPASSATDLIGDTHDAKKPKREGDACKKKKRRVSFGPPPRHYRRIVCFGDSNTWGYDPASQDRLEVRWPLIMREDLGSSYIVVEEGLNGRTIDKSDPVRIKEKGFSHSGLEHVASVLSSHKPLDLVVIFLGMNDLKTHLNPSVDSIIAGMTKLIARIKTLKVFPKLTKEQTAFTKTRVQILLMAPPLLTRAHPGTSFGEKSVEVSAALPPALERLAKKEKIHFLDTSEIIQTSELDSVHFGKEMHRKLGMRAAKKVQDLFLKSEEGE